ncbi:hypothetical protein [Streptomyces zhihengii]|uniref:Uncharacterized protein n=1 Tax=Streptomyces zhihengii TaxID=1818004 RepID=A0ABS2UWF2_9ACTN|nr:hypothetical protein [Streptomyces zhihengii]MBM9621015.1 hypothetical protein [Streptomyces zhihengii]
MTTSQQPPNTATEAPALARVPDAWLTFWAGVWRAAAIVFIGSGIISGVIVGWISRGLAARLTGLILGAGVILGLPYTWRILGLTAALWLALAIVLGRRVTTSSKPKEKDKEQPAKAPKRTVADLTREETVTALHTLLKPSGGVQLKTLGDHLAKGLGAGPVRTREVRALLTRHGIRHRAGVRVPGESGREGVHRDDVPPLSSPAPGASLEGVVVAGQGNNNNGNNASDHAAGEGLSITQDTANPSRWHVGVRPRA